MAIPLASGCRLRGELWVRTWRVVAQLVGTPLASGRRLPNGVFHKSADVALIFHRVLGARRSAVKIKTE